MTLEEAIKNLKADLLRPGSVDMLDFQDAEQLGIEALKNMVRLDKLKGKNRRLLLPSETKD